MDPQERWNALVEELCATTEGARPGMMFGRPCLKRGAKMAACLWTDGGIAVKLVDESDRAEALALAGAAPFDPGMGRKMREWVHVPAGADAAWEPLLRQALATLPTA
jgi:hypothetical protein